ncbi:MAG: G1 family glutamic endopeptidase, partial [Streptosporangiaceae bacterium]
LAALKQLMIGEHGTNHGAGGHAAVVGFGPKKVTSGNWSGYADDNSEGYSTVTAHWKEPTVNCGTQDVESMAAFWVGIDGYSSATVEQDGSLAYCYEDTAYYYTWWEMEPKYPIETVGNSVKAGDEITASVTRVGTKYTLKVVDSTNPDNSFTKYRYCPAKTCVDSSAEWVAEAPAGTSGQYPLAEFSNWQPQGATVTSATKSGTISSFPDYFITMDDSNTVLALPGPLNEAGNKFTDTWKASSH